jgi:uroporphyrinogen-III synthase
MELVAGPRNWDGAAACIGSTSANAASKAGLQKIYHPESPGIEGCVMTFHSGYVISLR